MYKRWSHFRFETRENLHLKPMSSDKTNNKTTISFTEEVEPRCNGELVELPWCQGLVQYLTPIFPDWRAVWMFSLIFDENLVTGQFWTG